MKPIEVEASCLLKTSDAGGRGRAARAAFADSVARTAVRCGLLILTWYFLSTALGLFNKKVVGKKYGIFGKGAFPAPLLLTGIQFAFQNVLARLVFATGLVERTGAPMTWRDWSRLVLPNGVVTGLDIGFSNTSLVHITMSFYTMCKSTTPIFLLAFAFLWGLETPSWSLAGVVAVIVSGLLLLVHGEAEFDATGFVLVMSASCMSGLRFTLTQVLLHGNKAGQDGAGKTPVADHGPSAFGGPLEVLELLTPVMAVTTLALSLVSEQLWVSLPHSPYFSSVRHCAITLGVILLGAVLAFLMVWTEYQVIKETSALTFMIAGTVKEVVTVITAVLVFGDKFGLVNGIGLFVVIAGVLLFNAYKLQKLKQQVRQRICSKDGSIDLNLDGDDPVSLGDAPPGAGRCPSGSPEANGLAARRKSGMPGAADGAGTSGAHDPRVSASGGGLAHDTEEQLVQQELDSELRTLEAEPLLPLSGVMIRR